MEEQTNPFCINSPPKLLDNSGKKIQIKKKKKKINRILFSYLFRYKALGMNVSESSIYLNEHWNVISDFKCWFCGHTQTHSHQNWTEYKLTHWNAVRHLHVHCTSTYTQTQFTQCHTQYRIVVFSVWLKEYYYSIMNFDVSLFRCVRHFIYLFNFHTFWNWMRAITIYSCTIFFHYYLYYYFSFIAQSIWFGVKLAGHLFRTRIHGSGKSNCEYMYRIILRSP